MPVTKSDLFQYALFHYSVFTSKCDLFLCAAYFSSLTGRHVSSEERLHYALLLSRVHKYSRFLAYSNRARLTGRHAGGEENHGEAARPPEFGTPGRISRCRTSSRTPSHSSRSTCRRDPERTSSRAAAAEAVEEPHEEKQQQLARGSCRAPGGPAGLGNAALPTTPSSKCDGRAL